MGNKFRGFSNSEIVELYKYLCIYEGVIKNIGSQKELMTTYPNLKELEILRSSFACSKCTRNYLSSVGILSLNNLVSMTSSRSSILLSFLNHLRNSIAHGLIEREGGYVHFSDYLLDNKIKRFSANGKIKSSVTFKIIQIIIDNVDLS